MANDALSANPSTSTININVHGSDWLWAAFAVMLLSDLIFIFMAYRQPTGSRAFFQMPIMLLTTASIAYFAMASNLGGTPIRVEFLRGYMGNDVTRSIWYVRYIDWTITTPLLLLELLLGTGLPLSDIVTVIFMDLVMIITGLVGALVASSYKWGFYTIGCFALFYVWWILLGPARVAANALSPAAGKAYVSSAGLLSILWLCYPIAWAVADGGNVIGSDGEMVFYGVLDILAKPVFCFFHVWSMRNVEYGVFQLNSGKASVGARTPGYSKGAEGGFAPHDHTSGNDAIGDTTNATGVHNGNTAATTRI